LETLREYLAALTSITKRTKIIELDCHVHDSREIREGESRVLVSQEPSKHLEPTPLAIAVYLVADVVVVVLVALKYTRHSGLPGGGGLVVSFTRIIFQ